MTSRRLAPFTLLATGILIGFLSGYYLAPHAIDRDGGTSHPRGAVASDAGENSRGRRISDSQGDKSPNGSRSISKAESRGFAESVRAIFRETSEERRLAMFEKMLDKLSVEQYADVVALVRENDLRGSDTGYEWSKLWSSWGRRDPAAAFEFIKNQDWSGWDPIALEEAKSRALTTWSQGDLEQARRFVEGGNAERPTVYGLMRGWSDTDPYEAAKWLSKSGLGMAEDYKAVVEAISRKGGTESLESWFSTLDQNEISARDKNGFAQEIAHVKQEYEPEKAAAWVEQHSGEAWLEDSGIVQSTARAFASRDPEGAMKWAEKAGLESAATTAMGTWVQQDLPAASAWLSENSQNPVYAQSADMVLSYLQHHDPAAAKTWAESLPNQAMRNRMLDQLQNK